MARFRNLLVHMDWKVDYDALYARVQNNLEDLRRFSKAIVAVL